MPVYYGEVLPLTPVVAILGLPTMVLAERAPTTKMPLTIMEQIRKDMGLPMSWDDEVKELIHSGLYQVLDRTWRYRVEVYHQEVKARGGTRTDV